MSYKRIDLTQLGGFPLTQETLAFMQAAYNDKIDGVAKRMGNGIVLSGMVDNGTAVTDGWIIYNNEILPFKGGNKQTYFIIEETDGQAQFEDDSVKTVYFTRQARFGSGAGQVAYSSLKRLDTALKVQQDLADLNTNLTTLINTLSASLTAHEQDKNNPHEVTKDQVGLGNLPNAKSDSIALNDSNSLATSAAVYGAAQQNKIVKAGSQWIGNLSGEDSNLFTIQHNAGIAGNYVAMCVFRATGSPTASNDVIFVVYDLFPDSFKISAKELVTHTQSLYLDYALIKY